MELNPRIVESKEEQGRRIVTEVLNYYGVNQIEPSVNQYEHFDLSYTGMSIVAKVEIKYRIDYPSTHFKAVILQQDKYDYLMKEFKEDPTHTPLYWTVWKDKVSWIVDLTKLQPKWEKKEMRLNNEEGRKVYKDVCLIPFNKEKKEEGKWIIPYKKES